MEFWIDLFGYARAERSLIMQPAPREMAESLDLPTRTASRTGRGAAIPSAVLALVALGVLSGLFSLAWAHGLGAAPDMRGPSVEITGIVRADDGTPLEGAIVTLQASRMRAVTAPDGSYSLTIPGDQGSMIVAAAVGHLNSGQTFVGNAVMDFTLSSTPSVDHPSYQFLDPLACTTCHQEQVNQWTNSPMARGGINTWLHDLYDGDGTPGGMGGFVYTRDSEFADTNLASECAACHQPEVWIEQPFSAMLTPNDPGYPSTAVLHGISCETCHKMASVDVEKIDFPGIFPGAVDFVRPAPGEQVMYGVWGDSSYHAQGVMEPSYQPQLLAEACGACHQDKNDPHEDHTYSGITSEPTYTEWVESPYGNPESIHYKTCVDCHMPPTGATTACALAPVERDPQTIRSHDIRGTTPEFLENAVELSADYVLESGALKIQVEVDNAHTGHHVPTGVTVRNMILLVEAWRESDGEPLQFVTGPTVHALGGVGDPEQGYYAGLPGRLFAKFIRDAHGNGPTFFTDAAELVFDTRLPAFAVDRSTYEFAVPQGTGDVHVRARLIYRRAFRALVDLKGWTEDGHGRPLADIAPPHFGHLKEMIEFTVPGPVCPCDWNDDGFMNDTDFFDFVNDFFSQAGPQGQSDFNEDGFENPQDWFDFVNCFFAQPAGCD